MNPETKKLRQRVSEYHKQFPEYKERPPKRPHRKHMNTQKRLQPGTPCAYCGKILTKHTATIDHIIPISAGGSDHPKNLCWCCINCNRSKGKTLLSDWRK